MQDSVERYSIQWVIVCPVEERKIRKYGLNTHHIFTNLSLVNSNGYIIELARDPLLIFRGHFMLVVKETHAKLKAYIKTRTAPKTQQSSI